MCAGLFPNVAQVQRQSNARGTPHGGNTCSPVHFVVLCCLCAWSNGHTHRHSPLHDIWTLFIEVPYFCKPPARTLCTTSFEPQFSSGKCPGPQTMGVARADHDLSLHCSRRPCRCVLCHAEEFAANHGWLLFHDKVKTSQVYLHDTTLIGTSVARRGLLLLASI